jgi:hypothetical protein
MMEMLRNTDVDNLSRIIKFGWVEWRLYLGELIHCIKKSENNPNPAAITKNKSFTILYLGDRNNIVANNMLNSMRMIRILKIF